jgi:tripartite-type tricarboxylate transporter receptor subunit TctC
MNYKSIIAGIALALMASAASALQTVTVYWPFSIGDPTVTNLRALFDRANLIQNEYNFLIVATPGAGGAIAARKAASSQEPALLATTTAFFIRPMLFADANYNFSEFTPSLVLVTSPFALIASNKSDINWSGKLSLGVPGLGSTVHAIGEKIKQKHPNLIIVPYKGMSDATNDLLAGHINLSINLVRPAEQNPDIKILGITGARKVKDYKLLSELGIAGVEHVVSDVLILRSTSMPTAVATRIDDVLKQANDNNPGLLEIYKQDSATLPYSLKTQAQRNEWYETQIRELKKLTSGIKIVE